MTNKEYVVAVVQTLSSNTEELAHCLCWHFDCVKCPVYDFVKQDPSCIERLSDWLKKEH